MGLQGAGPGADHSANFKCSLASLTFFCFLVSNSCREMIWIFRSSMLPYTVSFPVCGAAESTTSWKIKPLGETSIVLYEKKTVTCSSSPSRTHRLRAEETLLSQYQVTSQIQFCTFCAHLSVFPQVCWSLLMM